ncbi:ATP-binding protein [Pseudoduganella albidiflava]|uniref:histidine kinase n=1 Tax=Pseudoduganella albidiflava TaxID=321983 RepID=A0A411WX36_9BURK|nr:ATP-binding protein [Pseudoduganella albidiflava]QBI01266.1 response regulator [Pseudoduganella albidiflava]GGY37047.1 hybrid sensor histidine kinase/response regulator [Pseudoduganella albidiflava]
MHRPDAAEQRVLVLAPRGRDAEVTAGVVARHGARCDIVADFPALAAGIVAGAATAIVTDEALHGADLAPLHAWLAAQEPWSDFPFIVLLGRRIEPAGPPSTAMFASLGNVILLERPLSAATLGSATGAALRARHRQYQARAVLADREQVSQELAVLNATLESRVAERTRALAQANDRLTAEVIEREKAQQAMLQYQKMDSLGRLTGGVAHDFNNLLNVVQGSMELILATSTDAAVRRRAETAKAACERGARLTAQLLAFARNQTLNLRPLPVAALFDSVLQMARPLLGDAFEIVTGVAPRVAAVLADLSQMEMALLNLVINARDAMPGGGRIVLHASLPRPPAGLLPDSEPGAFVRIAVSDNGPGMSADIAARVFEPFFTTKAVGKGTGLGLSQVYGMARQSGGIARLESTPGQGTTVEMWLPASDGQETGETDAAEQGTPLDGLEVLLVEDDDFVRTCMADALATLGCQVAQVADGAAGLDALAGRRPGVLVTDYLMPGITGAELARKARERFAGLPIVVVTGYADMDAIRHAVGDVEILRKPFLIAELGAAVRKVLRAAPAT